MKELSSYNRVAGYLNKVFDLLKGKSTNSEFIALIADKLQLQLKSAEIVNY